MYTESELQKRHDDEMIRFRASLRKQSRGIWFLMLTIPAIPLIMALIEYFSKGN